jgi:ABC-type Fe3+-hydroxamate transport system substrate-binding protein
VTHLKPQTFPLMPIFTDQLAREIAIDGIPQRIVSIVPSQTELLSDLGLDEQVVGITKFCIHPNDWFRTKTRVGGTKQLNIEKIKELQPDLILANKEENEKEQVEALSENFPVWVSDIHDLDDALQMINAVGELTGTKSKATIIRNEIEQNFSALVTPAEQFAACYLIWREPYMTIGGDSFISEMMTRTGFDNIFKNETRYPVVTIDQIKNASCKFLLLSSEPYPFKEKHIEELQYHLPNTRIFLVDGEMFSWYGSRLIKAAAYFHQLQQQVLSLTNAAGSF